MNCYDHQDRFAVGICSFCNKGVCSECAVDVGKGLACRNSCEDDVRASKALGKRAMGSYPKTGRAYMNSAMLYGVLGLVFLAYGFQRAVEGDSPASCVLAFVTGIAFSLGSFLSYKSAKQIVDINE